MELSSLVNLFVFPICILVVAADISCSLEKSHPDECTCHNDTLICSKKRETEPSFSEISRDVRELTITGYKIEELNTTRLLGANLINLKKLDLSNNRILTVTADSFSGDDFPVLQTLVLEDNEIVFSYSNESLGSRVFHGLSSLTELNLNNALNKDFLRSGMFTGLLNQSEFVLRKLVLTENEMSYLSTELFALESTRSLEELYLSHNELRSVFDDTFTKKRLPNLTLLDLSHNSLDTITKKNIEDFKTFDEDLMQLNLSGNPFRCRCQLRDFIIWLNDTNLVEGKADLMCRNIAETPILDVTAHQIKCNKNMGKHRPAMYSQYVTLCIIFAIIGLLALIILFMRRKDIVRFCQQVRQATKDAFDSHQTHYNYSGIQHARRETADSGVASVEV
ncbi:trophoblast glycoprotein-like [Apostichopus japonicus]|uniref:trophoblast glycoprotein-like n=1 Tax=Stichopus japonicus TaxID=307972 RepID=UPI003AB3D1DC